MTRNETAGVFDSMTQAILDRKRGVALPGEAPPLTPVGMEARQGVVQAEAHRAVTPEVAGATPPPLTTRDADMFEAPPRHQLWVFAESIRDMIRAGEALLAVLPASNAQPIQTLGDKWAEEDAQKAKERLADELFSEQYRAKQEAAQAATYAATPVESVGYTGWACPVHGSTAVQQETSPKGRKFAACQVGGCKQFER